MALHEAVKLWPEQFKIRAQRVLTLLEKQKRFRIMRTTYTPESRCAISHCQHSIGIATSLGDERIVILAGGGCCTCSRAILVKAQVVDVRGYAVSEFSQKRRQWRSVLLSDGEWTSTEFERFVLSPVVRQAEVVKIYDRLITRTINLVDPSGLSESLGENYRLTLEWIMSVFSRESPSEKKRVEIYSAVSTGVDKKQLKNLEKIILEFLDGVAATGIRPTVFIKEETKNLRMPHGRYLITDMFGLLVERGFDLLWDDESMKRAGLDLSQAKRKVRDSMISICPNPGGVETAVNRLRDLRVFS